MPRSDSWKPVNPKRFFKSMSADTTGSVAPLIKLEIQNMRHQVTMMIGKHLTRLEDQAAKALDKEIENFNIDALVRDMAHGIFKEELRKTLTRAFKEIQWDEDFRRELAKSMTARVQAGSHDGLIAKIANLEDENFRLTSKLEALTVIHSGAVEKLNEVLPANWSVQTPLCNNGKAVSVWVAVHTKGDTVHAKNGEPDVASIVAHEDLTGPLVDGWEWRRFHLLEAKD